MRKDGKHIGWGQRGNHLRWSKLTDAQIQELKAWYRVGGWTMTALAEAFGISLTSCSAYINGTRR